jgi:hypothetical protein
MLPSNGYLHYNRWKERKVVDKALECVRCLKVTERPVNQWDDMLEYIITSKLYPVSRSLWELQRADMIPTFKRLTEFLAQRPRILANARLNKSKCRVPTSRRNNRSSNYCSSGSKNGAAAYVPAVPPTCECVRGSHVLVEYQKFKDAAVKTDKH